MIGIKKHRPTFNEVRLLKVHRMRGETKKVGG